MSRRPPNPSAERNAQNQATLKSLLKLEQNKVCADCKRNKHPRWASWNLGVFICIRCSGIHRGMGTHISRVKSVDLDSWTDEQMKSIISWGNARANKYWEAKLAAGHAPSESKIENFIRTKYELKRWTMEGPIPDPSTLDAEGDDNVPLSVVKEKQNLARNESIRSQQQASRSIPAPDLIGGDDPAPARASTTSPPASKVPPKAEAAPPKATSTKDSLLGLDFLGQSAAPARPASTSGVNAPGGQSRPDLKQSILSLYASAPRPQAQPQQGAQQQSSFGGMTSPTNHQQQGSMSGFNDAFGGLSMSGSTSSPPPPSDPFASLGSASSGSRPPSHAPKSSFSNLGGGSFFDAKPAQTSPPPQQFKPASSNFDAFGSFTSPSAAPAPPPAQTKPAAPAQSAMADLFDFSAPAAQPVASPPPPAMSPTPAAATSNSVFNLSAPQSKPGIPSPPANPTTTSSFGGLSGADAWGGNEWATPAAPNPITSPAQKSPALAKPSTNDFGWGSGGSLANTPIVPGASGGLTTAAPPKVAADEEFGGWASSTGNSNTNAVPKSGGGFGGGDDDLFSNVWQ